MPAGKIYLATRATGKTRTDKAQDKKIAKLERIAKTLDIIDEKKWLDLQASYSVSTTPVVVNMTQLDVWNGSNANRHRAREGNSILLTNLRFKGMVSMPAPLATTSDVTNRLRCIVVKMTDTPAIPSSSDILQANTIDSFYRIQGNLKYSVLFDRVYNLTNLYQSITAAPAFSALGSCNEPWRIPLQINLAKKAFGKVGSKVQYAQGSGTGDNPIDNGIYMILLSDSNVLTHPNLRFNSRMRFYDN